MTTKPCDTQRAILAAAGAAPDGLVRPEHISLKGGAAGIVLDSLFKRRLLE